MDHPLGGQPLLVTDPENLAESRRSNVTLGKVLGLLNSSWRQQLRHNALVDERLQRIQSAVAALTSSVEAFADQVSSRDNQRNAILEAILAKPGNP